MARRRASMVLPAPGEPTSRTLCPPAAATSSARLACACPLTSAKSPPCFGASAAPLARGVGGSHVPRRNPATSARPGAPTTRTPSTRAASPAFGAGTTTPSRPARAAAMATESTPGVATRPPFKESSPKNENRASLSPGT